jgi:hypothetical protein
VRPQVSPASSTKFLFEVLNKAAFRRSNPVQGAFEVVLKSQIRSKDDSFIERSEVDQSRLGRFYADSNSGNVNAALTVSATGFATASGSR